jgi:hypothetical protein
MAALPPTQPGAAVPHDPPEPRNKAVRKIDCKNLNGFWVLVCQDVLFSERASPENPIDCRIIFTDTPQ